MQVRHHGHHRLMRFVITVRTKPLIQKNSQSACNFIYHGASFHTIIRHVMANDLRHPLESYKGCNLLYKMKMKLAFRNHIYLQSHVRAQIWECRHSCISCEELNSLHCSAKTDKQMIIQMPISSLQVLSKHQELSLTHLRWDFIIVEYLCQKGQYAPARRYNGMRHCKTLKCTACLLVS